MLKWFSLPICLLLYVSSLLASGTDGTPPSRFVNP